jgi:hypothetical protein
MWGRQIFTTQQTPVSSLVDMSMEAVLRMNGAAYQLWGYLGIFVGSSKDNISLPEGR